MSAVLSGNSKYTGIFSMVMLTGNRSNHTASVNRSIALRNAPPGGGEKSGVFLKRCSDYGPTTILLGCIEILVSKILFDNNKTVYEFSAAF